MAPGKINLGGNSDALKQQKHKTVATITAVKSSIEMTPGKIDFGGNSDASKQQKRRHDITTLSLTTLIILTLTITVNVQIKHNTQHNGRVLLC